MVALFFTSFLPSANTHWALCPEYFSKLLCYVIDLPWHESFLNKWYFVGEGRVYFKIGIEVTDVTFKASPKQKGNWEGREQLILKEMQKNVL